MARIIKLIQFGCLALCLLVITTGCTMNMRDQPRRDPLQTSRFFPDNRAARPLVENTIARGYLVSEDPHFYTGITEDGEIAPTYPFEITRDVLKHGQERYTIYCSPCHGITGDGNGMIVQRGMKQPNSFHTETIKSQPPGYYFNAITNGFGTMYSYASRIPPEDRWAITAYIQTLQLSQSATEADVPADKKEELEHSEATE